MTENGITSITSPITERSNVSRVAQSQVIAAGSAHEVDQPDTGSRVATAVPSAAAQPTAAAQATAQHATPAQHAAKIEKRDLARDQVTVKMPADGAYLSVLRTATAGLAARLDFTLDEIEDMRIAVDEACAMLLSQAIPGSDLECRFALGRDEMTVSVSVRCLAPRVPAGDTFAWTVLSALAGSVDAQVGPGDVLTIALRKSRDSSWSA